MEEVLQKVYQMSNENKKVDLIEANETIQWLTQFDGGDKLLAQSFLNNLILISSTEFDMGLSELIENIGNRQGGKVALFPIKPIRNVGFTQNIIPAEAASKPNALSDGIKPEAKEPAVGKLRRERYNSSHRIGYLLNNLERNYPRKYSVSPTIESMRAERIPNIVLVDDIIGTGDSVYKYWKTKISKSIKSWISYKKCNVWVVAYAAHFDAISYITRKINPITKENISIKIEVLSPPIFWNDALENLCQEYGKRTNKQGAALGYGKCRSHIVFQHGCPNNAPAMLWARGKTWEPLFPNRGIPLSLQHVFDSNNQNLAIDNLFKSGQYRLAIKLLDAYEYGYMSDKLISILLMLGFLLKGVKPENLKDAMIVSSNVISKNIRTCIKAGFLDRDAKLTTFGIDLLRRYKSELFSTESAETVANPAKLYYPSQFLGHQRKFSGFPDGQPSGSK